MILFFQTDAQPKSNKKPSKSIVFASFELCVLVKNLDLQSPKLANTFDFERFLIVFGYDFLKNNHKLWFLFLNYIFFWNHNFLVASAASYGSFFWNYHFFWNHNFLVASAASYGSFFWNYNFFGIITFWQPALPGMVLFELLFLNRNIYQLLLWNYNLVCSQRCQLWFLVFNYSFFWNDSRCFAMARSKILQPPSERPCLSNLCCLRGVGQDA